MSKPPRAPLDLNRLRQDIIFEDRLMEHQFVFHTTWGLFSPRDIDEGTHLLLRHMTVHPDEQAIDLGCGYGPIGMAIAQSAPQGHCLMVDKDFVAVDYANANLRRNGIGNAEAMLSNGLHHVPADRHFTLAATNLPAKTNKEHYYLFFHDIRDRLEPGGRCYVVVISGLRRFIERAFGEVFGNHTKVKQGRQYTVAMAEKR